MTVPFDLSAHVNWLFDDDVPVAERVERLAAAGVDGYGWDPWRLDTDDDGIRRIAAVGDDLGLDLVYLSATHVDLTTHENPTPLADVEALVALAGELDARTLNLDGNTLVPGASRGTVDDHLVERLEPIADAAEGHGVVVLLEPTNPFDRPDRYLRTPEHCAEIVERVGSPNLRVLLDLYHQQLTAGNVVRTIREYADDIAHVHVGSVPERAVPGTGELDYGRVLRELAAAGYEGYVECEFVPPDGPEAAIRAVDDLVEASFRDDG